MKLLRTLAYAFAAAATVMAHAGHDHDHDDEVATPENSDVVVLNKSSFDDFVKKPLTLVEFYAPWCGHCKSLAPEYEIAATALKEANIPIAKVDCTVETEICNDKVKIQGYPTLKVFRNGEASDYKGPRKADGIISHMKKQDSPAVTILETAEIEKFASSDNVVVVAYVKKDSKEAKAFADVADKLRDNYLFGYSTDAAAAKAAGVTVPGVVLHKKFDEGKNDFDGKFDEEVLTEFVKTNATPLMDEISPENYAKYMESGLPIGYLFWGTAEERAEVGPKVEKMAKFAKGKVNFVYCDASKFGGHAKNLNIKDEKWPAFVIQDTKGNSKFPFDQSKDIGSADFEDFVKSFVDGTLLPSLKSEEIPATNDAPVKIVVGKSYESIVLDKSKDVLLEIYAPWCGHCKKLSPIYDELAEKLADVKSITIAKMDATENDLPPKTPFTVEGFPTIKFFRAATNEIVDYDGARTLDGFLEFLKKEAKDGKSITAVADEEEEETEEHDEL